MAHLQTLFLSPLVALCAARTAAEFAWPDAWPLALAAMIGSLSLLRPQSTPAFTPSHRPSLFFSLYLLAIILWLFQSFTCLLRCLLEHPHESTWAKVILGPQAAFTFLFLATVTELFSAAGGQRTDSSEIGRASPPWRLEFLAAALLASAGLALPMIARLLLRAPQQPGLRLVAVCFAVLPALVSPPGAAIALRTFAAARGGRSLFAALGVGVILGLVLRLSFPLDPENRTAHEAAKDIELTRRLENALHRGYPQRAVQLFPSIRQPENNPIAFYYLGRASWELGKRDLAGKAFQKAISVAPHHVDGHYRFALHLEASGQSERAQASLSQTLQILPNHLPAIRLADRLGWPLPPESQKFQEWITSDPMNFGGELALAGCKHNAGPTYSFQLAWECLRESNKEFSTLIQFFDSQVIPSQCIYAVSDLHPFSGNAGQIGEVVIQTIQGNLDKPWADKPLYPRLSVVENSERLTLPLTIRSSSPAASTDGLWLLPLETNR